MAQKGELTEKDAKRLQELYSEKVEEWLDAGHGECHLKSDKVGMLMEAALKHFQGERYVLYAWCIMPNHVHVIFSPINNHKVEAILHSWKSFTANAANKVLGRTGAFWMEEYYDHLIRDQEDFARQWFYVRNNPVKAGLKDWKFVGSLGQDGQGVQGLEAPATHCLEGSVTELPAAELRR